jgi:UPF0755 protein
VKTRDDFPAADVFDDDDMRARRALDRGRRRRMFVLVLLLVVVPIGAIVAVGGWFWFQLDPPGEPGANVEVDVTPGWGVPEIADELATRDVVSSAFVFEAYAKLTGAGPFQAGTYTLRRDLGVRDAIDVLERGPAVSRGVELEIIPGKWLTEIAQEVEQQLPWLDGEQFLQVARSGEVRSRYQPDGVDDLEGLLWPDTYEFAEGGTERDVVRRLVRQFDAEATEAGLAGANVRGYGPYDIVKVASLVQSEAKTDADRPLIASVIYNRLHAGMPLQIDATVQYALGSREPPGRSDTQVDHPYNTYKIDGLPPTPIAAITTASLRAALQPATSDYLFYVIADEKGGHAFARTYAEHEQNIEQARAKGLL